MAQEIKKSICVVHGCGRICLADCAYGMCQEHCAAKFHHYHPEAGTVYPNIRDAKMTSKPKVSPSLLIRRRMIERTEEAKAEGWSRWMDEGTLRITCWMDAVEEYLDGKLE